MPALARFIDLSSNWIYFNSRAVRREWGALLPEAKTRIVYNWIKPRPHANEPVPKVISELLARRCFIAMQAGSVAPVKRPLDAIHAVWKLVQEGRNVALVLLGLTYENAYGQEINDFIAQHRLEDRVYLVGYVENPDLFMKHAHVGLICSALEGFGRSTVELMAQGVPVIGTAAGGTLEIIEDELSGLLFPVGNVDALAVQMRRLMDDTPLREKLSRNARVRAQRFASPQSEMEPVMDHLRQLVHERNPSWPLGEMVSPVSSLNQSNGPGNLSWRRRAKRALRILVKGR